MSSGSSIQSGGGSAPKVTQEQVRITITNPDSPYRGRVGIVSRVRHGAHVDLQVEFEDEVKITVDSTWTDYWERVGEPPPSGSLLAHPEQARHLCEMLVRLERKTKGMGEVSEGSETNVVADSG